MHASLLLAIQERRARVGILGLGYVGLPLMRAFVSAGYRVLGFDVDRTKIEKLQRGESYIEHIPAEWIVEHQQSGAIEVTADPARLAEPDALVICVPTPLAENREPDLRFVCNTGELIAKVLRPGQLVVLESTTYPGTTRDVLLPILERTGLAVEQDFFVAYSPEREDPGNPRFAAGNIPKVVGGIGPQSHELAVALYTDVAAQVVPVSSTEVAEAAKILENTYRAVNIALVNELKVLFLKMGIDPWEVIEAARTKPFGFQAFYPGPGLGGHCIPIDPFYLSWLARRYGEPTRFIELAGEVNTRMPEYVIDRVTEALDARGKQLAGSRVAIFGIAYKRDVDDTRESPSLDLLMRLRAAGAELTYHDAHVPRLPRVRRFDLPQLESSPLTAEFLAAQDAVLIATDHTNVDYDFVVKHAPLVVDTRNATARVVEGREKIVKA